MDHTERELTMNES